MEAFDFQHRTRVVYGVGKIRELGRFASELGCKRALIVSDPGVVAAGHFAKGMQSVLHAGLSVESFHDLKENPTTTDIGRGLAAAKSFKPDLIIGLGGGSSMDCAKGINFLYSCGGTVQDYWGVGKATHDLFPMIAVPTTAGTGSEAQSFALITDADTKVKMACGDPKAAFRIAILDPELTLTQPMRVASLTGLDAMSHAMESYVTKRRNELSLCYSREAWRLLSYGLPRVFHNGKDLAARGKMQLGAFFAGLAIETSMLGAAHALANPLTARYGTVHGQAVALMLPHVVRFNGDIVSTWYDELWQITESKEIALESGEKADSASRLAEFVRQLTLQSGLATRLRDLNIQHDVLIQLAHDSTKQWTAQFNPREITEEVAVKLYEAAW
jgi:alcohol dehydrogenase